MANLRQCSCSLVIFLVASVFVVGCAQDRYQQRAETIKDHVERFYKHLEEDRVAAAVGENEHIEALGRELERGLLQRAGRMDTNQKTREWSMVKTANETAAENWLALARYFVQKQDYQRARGTYQRVIETYQRKPYEPFADRAEVGLRDLDLILAPSKNL